MTNDIMKTGRMYVVWHKDPNVKSPQDGIDQIITSIGWTGAEYSRWKEIARCEEAVAKIVRDEARESAENEYFAARGVPDSTSEEWKQYVTEFGSRAVYEVRVRYVGKVNANGKFKRVGPKKKKQRP